MTLTAFVLTTAIALAGTALGYYQGFVRGYFCGCIAPRRVRKRARFLAGQLAQTENE
jgi:hypothetical protein